MPNTDTELQAQLQRLQDENQQLRQQLQEREAQVYRLLQWLSQFQRDIRDVYRSVTWRIGHTITRFILKFLHRPAGPTAQDHIALMNRNLEAWKQDYLTPYRAQNKLLPYTPWHDKTEYAQWIAAFDGLNAQAVEDLQQAQSAWKHSFAVLLVLPESFEPSALQASITALEQQIYPHWTLYLIASPAQLESLACAEHEKITTCPCPPHTSRAEGLNLALEQLNSDWLLCLYPGDVLSLRALHDFAQAAEQNPKAYLLYSDEDVLDAQGERSDPYFKPDWNPDLFLAQDYLRHSPVYASKAVQQQGGFKADYPDWEHYDLSLRLQSQYQAQHIVHIPRVLYHAQPVLRDIQGQQAVLRDYFQQQAVRAEVESTHAGHTRVRYVLPATLPLVSVIIPTRDRLELLMGTVEGVLEHTDYPHLQVIIVDNGSRDLETLGYLSSMEQQEPNLQVVRHKAAFNYSQLNNLGAQQAQGKVLALLNNDLKIIHRDWLREMVSQALRRDIGAVGAKLYYQDDTVQHAGVITGLGGLAGHGFKHILREAPAYQYRPFLVQNMAAVTGACMLLRKSVFEEVGGFNETLKVAFNDVDLCLRIRKAGYRILWTPHAELYHLESASRGSDDTPRKYRQLQKEIAYTRECWGDYLQTDPFYNPNLSLQYEDYSLAWPPR